MFVRKWREDQAVRERRPLLAGKLGFHGHLLRWEILWWVELGDQTTLPAVLAVSDNETPQTEHLGVVQGMVMGCEVFSETLESKSVRQDCCHLSMGSGCP